MLLAGVALYIYMANSVPFIKYIEKYM